MNKRLGETNKQFVERMKREHAAMLADQFRRVADITKTDDERGE